MNYKLEINGVKMPTPEVGGIVVSDEKIWSSSTGRTATGKMSGSLIAIKHTIQIKWPRLTAAQAKTIRNAVSSKNEFVPMSFTDIDGTVHTLSVYCGTPKFTIYRVGRKGLIITGATVTAIEE